MKKYLFILFVIMSHCAMAQWEDSRKQAGRFSMCNPGEFFLGCNYWASNAGCNMWENWDEAVIDSDFKQLSKIGIKAIRVFPIWPVFQPIVNFYGGVNEVRFRNSPLPKEGLGSMGIDSVAMARFKKLSDLAHKYDIRLVVGLVTGFMSSRLYLPPALEGKNPITDPAAKMWQIRFIRSFVKTMKYHPAIWAWDLGNECNMMGTGTREQNYLWTAAISNAIKSEDDTRMIVSGMHGLSAAATSGAWRIQDQAELTDILTTHPYPMWTPYANQDHANTIRTIMHSVSETRMYADIGEKPCLVEEIGIMGPMEAGESATSAFFKSVAFNLWANDCQSLMWWCAYDQPFDEPPYEWTAVERDLGLIKIDRSPKKVACEMEKFSQFLERFPYKPLPLRKIDAVCILTEGSDQWATAYSSYILSKQAGFEIQFQNSRQPLKNAAVYMLPSVSGKDSIPEYLKDALLDRVENGATLYISSAGGDVWPFLGSAGIHLTNETVSAEIEVKHSDKLTYKITVPKRYDVVLSGAEVLARDQYKVPVFTANRYGKGKIYFLTVPLENSLTRNPKAFLESAPEYWKIYQKIASEIIPEKLVQKNHPMLSCTEHYMNEKEAIIVLVNNSKNKIPCKFGYKKGWKVKDVFYGADVRSGKIAVDANEALVFVMSKNEIGD